jgi:hypothetical protein
VLHLKNNPSLVRFQTVPDSSLEQMDVDSGGNCADAPPAYFVTPLDELRHLKLLISSGKLVPPAVVTTAATAASVLRPRSDNSSASNILDTSLSMSASRSNVSMSASSGVDSQKMNQRLKEVFREKIAEYREAVYLLFGYKVRWATHSFIVMLCTACNLLLFLLLC